MTPKITIFEKLTLFNSGEDGTKSSCQREHEVFDLTREVVCFNQGKIAEYYFLHDKNQNELKSKFTALYNSKDESLIPDLISTFDDYNNRVGSELNHIVNTNLSFANRYFLGRAETQVRGCIKLLDKDLNVIDPFRKNSKNYKYNKNTGFQRLIDQSKPINHYICQNIPEFIANKNYKNIRIDYECAKEYYQKQKPKNKISQGIKNLIYGEKKINIDSEWVKCWKGYGKEEPNAADCYKSTLIIPLTFENNSLAADFRSYINAHKDKKDKNTLGFLCFDHQDINYFIENADINFCYKVADLMSLYLLKDFTSKGDKHYIFIENFVNLIKNSKYQDTKDLLENIENIKKLN